MLGALPVALLPVREKRETQPVPQYSESSRWQSRSAHVFIGIGIGVVAGVATALVAEGDCKPTPGSDIPCALGLGQEFIVFGLVGGAIGGIVGALLPVRSLPEPEAHEVVPPSA